MRDELFRELIEKFKKAAEGRFPNLTIQGRQIEQNIYFLMELNGYPRGDIHYEIFARDWDVLLGLHFEGQNTRDEFRRRFEIKDDNLYWDTNFRKYRNISHRKVHNLHEEEPQQIAKSLVEMLEKMEESLGGRVRVLADDIL